jgi:cholest-4-en-3-one 26-monooxygenase
MNHAMTETSPFPEEPVHVGFEIIDPAYYGRYGYPHASWAYLRRYAPVSWHEPPGMRPFWAITRYADLLEISRDAKRFKIAPRMAVFPEEHLPTDNYPYRHLLRMDPPEHGKYRRVISGWFTPKVLEARREAIGKIIDEAIDKIADRTEVDFVESIAATVPLAVIAEMFGLPREDWDMMFRLSNIILGAADPEYQDGATVTEATEKATQAIFDYFRGISDLRRKQPRDDLVSVIANAKIDGEPMPEWELLSYFVLLIVAGNETTRNVTSGGLLALIENRDELERLRRDPALLPRAIEEILRYVSPVVQFCRTPIEDVELSGKKVRAGENLCLFYPSANYDEEVFEDPFSFRIDREPKEHFAFGIGVHYCLGVVLARMELREVFQRLLARVGHVEVSGSVERVASSFVGGIKRMPIRYRLAY